MTPEDRREVQVLIAEALAAVAAEIRTTGSSSYSQRDYSQEVKDALEDHARRLQGNIADSSWSMRD